MNESAWAGLPRSVGAPATLPPASAESFWRGLLIAWALTLLLLLPFLGKPLNIDDPLFVWTARHIVAHPADFYGFSVSWGADDGRPSPMSDANRNPPLAAYLLAVGGASLGWSEIALHLTMLLPTLAAVAGVHVLAARFCRFPLLATLLVMLSPGFLVSASTLMCDVPMLALWIWAVALWLRGSETAGRPWHLAAAGVACAAAILTKYSAIALLPLLAATILFWPGPSPAKCIMQAGALLIPIAALAAYEHYTAERYGQGLFLAATHYAAAHTDDTSTSPLVRTLDGLAYLGGTVLPAAAVAVVVLRLRTRLILATLVPIAALAAAAVLAVPAGWQKPLVPWHAWPFFLQAGVLIAAAAAALLLLLHLWLHQSLARPAWLLLCLWTVGVFVFAVYLNWTINVRSLLPLVVPVAIMAAAAVEQCGPAARRCCWGLAILAGAFAVMVLTEDAKVARAGRAAARSAQHVASAMPANGRSNRQVFFAGHWGFQYYAQQLGMRPLTADLSAYHVGDLLVVPLNNYIRTPVDLRGRIRIIGSQPLSTASWLTTMNFAMGAGFYHSSGNRLPYVAGPIPADAMLLCQFIAPMAQPTSAPSTPAAAQP